MEFISRERNYILHDALVECDCGCGMLRFSVYEDEPNLIYLHYYGEELQSYKKFNNTITLGFAKEMGIFLTKKDTMIDSVRQPSCGLRIIRDKEIPAFDITMIDKKERVIWSLCLDEDSAFRLGEILLKWSEDIIRVNT